MTTTVSTTSKPRIKAPPIHADFLTTPWSAALIHSPSTKVDDHEAETHGTLFKRTFCTQETLRAYQTLRTPEETITLISVGDGVNGHQHIMHGGMVATLLDEAMGSVAGISTFTAFLNITYKKPVPTPGVMMCRARVTRREGRKFFMQGSIEDGMGTVYATAESLFVEIMAKL